VDPGREALNVLGKVTMAAAGPVPPPPGEGGFDGTGREA
jgi:hypothetical protein